MKQCNHNNRKATNEFSFKIRCVAVNYYENGDEMSFKYNGDIAEISVTQTSFGQYIGLSQPKVSQMAANGEIVRDESDRSGRIMLAASLRDYYLSNKATGDGVNYWKEKAKREQVNRKIDEIKLRKMEGELYEAATVENTLIEILTVLRNNLLGMPAKFSKQLEGKSREEIYRMLTQEIEDRLEELSSNFDGMNFAADSIGVE